MLGLARAFRGSRQLIFNFHDDFPHKPLSQRVGCLRCKEPQLLQPVMKVLRFGHLIQNQTTELCFWNSTIFLTVRSAVASRASVLVWAGR
jgi:hypothetical protein